MNENLFRTKNYVFNLGIKFMSMFMTTVIPFLLWVNVTNVHINNILEFPPTMSECLHIDMKEFLRPCTEAVRSIMAVSGRKLMSKYMLSELKSLQKNLKVINNHFFITDNEN